jgi:hypothetical protein
MSTITIHGFSEGNTSTTKTTLPQARVEDQESTAPKTISEEYKVAFDDLGMDLLIEILCEMKCLHDMHNLMASCKRGKKVFDTVKTDEKCRLRSVKDKTLLMSRIIKTPNPASHQYESYCEFVYRLGTTGEELTVKGTYAHKPCNCLTLTDRVIEFRQATITLHFSPLLSYENYVSYTTDKEKFALFFVKPIKNVMKMYREDEVVYPSDHEREVEFYPTILVVINHVEGIPFRFTMKDSPVLEINPPVIDPITNPFFDVSLGLENRRKLLFNVDYSPLARLKGVNYDDAAFYRTLLQNFIIQPEDTAMFSKDTILKPFCASHDITTFEEWEEPTFPHEDPMCMNILVRFYRERVASLVEKDAIYFPVPKSFATLSPAEKANMIRSDDDVNGFMLFAIIMWTIVSMHMLH